MEDEVQGESTPTGGSTGDRWSEALELKEEYASTGEVERADKLRSLMKDPESDIRGLAGDIVIEHYSDIPADIILDLVEKFSKDGDPGLRTRAAKILFSNYSDLGDMTDESAVLLHGDTNVGVRRAVGKTVNEHFHGIPARIRERVISDMAEDPDPWVRRSAGEAIVAHYGELGEGSRAHLGTLEVDTDNWVREGILEVCAVNYSDLDGSLRDVFHRGAAEGPKEIRRRALSSLTENIGNFGDTQATTLLGLFFTDEDQDIRHEAAAAVGEILLAIGPAARSAAMTSLAESPDLTLRRTASNMVMDVYDDLDPSARSTLIVRLLSDEEQAVRYGILEGLEKNIARVNPGAAISLIEQFTDDPDVWVRNFTAKLVMDNCVHLGEATTPILVMLAIDRDIRVRREVAEGLVRHAAELPPAVKDTLIGRLENDEDPFVVKSIAELAASDWDGADETMRSRLLGALINDDPSVQVGAARAVMDHIDSLPRHVVERCFDLIEPSATEDARRGFMDIFGERLNILPEWLITEVVGIFTADPSPWVRARLVDALNESFSQPMLTMIKEVVQKLRDDRNPEVTESLLYLLQEHLTELDKTGRRTLDMFLDPDEEDRIKVRVSAVIMRNRSTMDLDVMPFLEELALSEDQSVRLEFFELFMEESQGLRPAERKLLVDIFLEDEDSDIRTAAGTLDDGGVPCGAPLPDCPE